MGPMTEEMREANRDLIAERLHWPDGAVDVCRALERQHPGFTVWWGTGRANSRPGFYAERLDAHWRERRCFYGENALDLGNALMAREGLWGFTATAIAAVTAASRTL